MNRRSFFEKMASGLLLSSALPASLIAYNPAKKANPKKSEYLENSKKHQGERFSHQHHSYTYPATHTRCTIQNVLFENLGITHEETSFHRRWNYISPLIQSADTLLLEEGPSFDNIREYALGFGKNVLMIDHISRVNFDAMLANSFFSSGLGLFGLLYSHRCTKREFLKMFSLGMISSQYSLTPVTSLPTWITDNPRYDFSFLVAARSALMLENIITIGQKKEYGRLLSITGDFHAQMMLQYVNNPQEFSVSLSAYKLAYGLLLDSGIEAYTPLGDKKTIIV